MAEKPYPWGRTYLCCPYKGVPPRTLLMDNKISEIKANRFVKATVAFFEQVSDEEHRGIAGL